MTRRLVAVSAVVLLVTATACGDSESDTASTSTAAPTTTAAPTAVAEQPPTSQVSPTPRSAADTALVESIVDAFNAALVDTDPHAAAALFADDGVFIDKFGTRRVGSAGISAYVEQVGPGITRCERTGPVEAVDSESYVFSIEFTYRGVDYARDVALTMENGLITLHEWQTDD